MILRVTQLNKYTFFIYLYFKQGQKAFIRLHDQQWHVDK